MKKTIFTYSRKRPTTTLSLSSSAAASANEDYHHRSCNQSNNGQDGGKRTKLAIEEWENLQLMSTNVTMRRHHHVHGNNNGLAVNTQLHSTPQTRRHNEAIKETLAKADKKLVLLSSSSSSSSGAAQQFSLYKKVFRLTPSAEDNGGIEQGIPDLLAVLRQTDVGVLGFEEWLAGKACADVCKIGEATFSEVFCFNGEEVVKIIPLQQQGIPVNEDIFPLPIAIGAAIHECKVLRRISMLKEHRTAAQPLLWTGFNQLLDICVVRGPYPERLIEAWKSFSIVKETENTLPDFYNDADHFLIISLQHGGVDLEGFKFEKIEEIRSIICQLACALALAEERAEFEHRDLHLGNVLVERIGSDDDDPTLLQFEDGNTFSFPADGVMCSIIDYSLSRVSMGSEVLFRDLDCLPWLFDGDDEKDSQFRVYKDMKLAKSVERTWRDFCPKSNVLWMAFLLERLVLKQKSPMLRKPKKQFDELKDLAKRAISYPSISALLSTDEFFQKYLKRKHE